MVMSKALAGGLHEKAILKMMPSPDPTSMKMVNHTATWYQRCRFWSLM